jgi:hypothetical protein
MCTGKIAFVPGFETLCTVSGDTRDAFLDAKRRTATNGTRYRNVEVSWSSCRTACRQG